MALLCSAYYSTDCKCVNTGEIIISKNCLNTSFIKECSVLAFEFDNRRYMAHVDSFDITMKDRLYDSLLDINEYLPNVSKFNIYIGNRCNKNCKSYILIRDILNQFKITNINIYQLSKNKYMVSI